MLAYHTHRITPVLVPPTVEQGFKVTPRQFHEIACREPLGAYLVSSACIPIGQPLGESDLQLYSRRRRTCWKRFCEALQLERVDLVGNDGGGEIVRNFAARYRRESTAPRLPTATCMTIGRPRPFIKRAMQGRAASSPTSASGCSATCDSRVRGSLLHTSTLSDCRARPCAHIWSRCSRAMTPCATWNDGWFDGTTVLRRSRSSRCSGSFRHRRSWSGALRTLASRRGGHIGCAIPFRAAGAWSNCKARNCSSSQRSFGDGGKSCAVNARCSQRVCRVTRRRRGILRQSRQGGFNRPLELWIVA